MPHNLHLGGSSSYFSSYNSFSFPLPEKKMEFGFCYTRSLDGIHVEHTHLLKAIYVCIRAHLHPNPLLHVLSCHVVKCSCKRRWRHYLLDNDWFGSDCECIQTEHWNMAKNERKVKDSLLHFLSSLLFLRSCCRNLHMELQLVSHG